MSSSIPLIPLSQPRDRLIAAVRSACLTHGFFQITDFPAPSSCSQSTAIRAEDLQTQLLSHARQLFNQTEEFKLSLAKTDHVRGGYEQFQQYSLQTDRGKPDLNEGFAIAPEFVEKADQNEVNGGTGHDVWPRETEENGLVGFRRTCREYYDYTECLARILAGIIAEGLGLAENYFAAYFERQMAHCRLIHYHAEERADVDKGSSQDGTNDIGAGLHTDWGLITILLQDSVGGLQVLDNSTETYIPVPPTPGAYVVNCGDLLSRFTNGVYTSAKHRVVAPPAGVDRYSVPFFCDGNPDYLVDVLPLGEEWKAWAQGRKGKPVDVEERIYDPVSAGEYFEMKWNESIAGGKQDVKA